MTETQAEADGTLCVEDIEEGYKKRGVPENEADREHQWWEEELLR